MPNHPSVELPQPKQAAEPGQISQVLRECLNVVLPSLVRNFVCLPPCKGGQGFGKLIFFRQGSTADQHWSNDDVTAESRLIPDLGADSLDVVELVMAFEEEFEVEIPDEAAEKIATVKDAIEFLKQNTEG